MFTEHFRGMGIDFAREALERRSLVVSVLLAGMICAAASIHDESFDAAIMRDVLCHRSMPDKARVLREGWHVLESARRYQHESRLDSIPTASFSARTASLERATRL